METSMAYYQTRLATFQGKAAAKTRRTSSKSKKAAPKSKGAWPYASPSAEDLAYAGFVFAPTSASPDNVKCWACNCQLDGWEEADVPLYEHVTHSPHCGFAVVTAIRLRHGDPARTEEDPTSDAMVAARTATFADLWPLDVAAGYPSVEQLAAAGWSYDPAEDMPDGVTCPYCHLALDAWEAGDDPLEEHRKRQSDCLFFSLTELYHPTSKPESKGKAKRVTKAKRASSRSSTASNATTATKKTRGKYGASEPIEDETDMSDIPTKATRGKQRGSSALEEFSSIHMSSLPAKKTRGKKRGSEAIEDESSMSVLPAKKTRGRPRASEATEDASSMSVLPKKNTRGKARASEAIDDASSMSVLPKKNPRGKTRASEAVEEASSMSIVTKKTTRGKKRTSDSADEASSMSILPKKATRGKKRTSEAVDDDTHMSESQHDASKRMRFSSISSFPDDLPAGTPKKIPTEMWTEYSKPFTMSSFPSDLPTGTPKKMPTELGIQPDTQPFTMSSFPSDLLTGTPKRQPIAFDAANFTMSSLPPDLLTGTPKRTPPHLRKDKKAISIWQPIDIENFPTNQQAVRGFFNDIMVDAGLDGLSADDTTAEEFKAAVLAGLTNAEKEMTIEQWVMYNAKRGEEKLREACEQQILAFEAQGRRALATLAAIPTY